MFVRYVFLRWTITCLWSASFGASFFRASSIFHQVPLSKFNVHNQDHHRDRTPPHSSSNSAVQDGDLESQSAHLKLLETKTINNDENGTTSNDDDDDSSNHLLIREYIFANDTSKILLAAVGGPDNLQLELYSKHVFGRNYSRVEGVLLRETKLDVQNTSLFNMYVDLWKSERLIANSKDFPNDTNKKGEDKVGKFIGPLAGEHHLYTPHITLSIFSCHLTGYYETNLVVHGQTPILSIYPPHIPSSHTLLDIPSNRTRTTHETIKTRTSYY